jgi:hypothetical protein
MRRIKKNIKNESLQKQIDYLRWQNLKLRLEIEILTENPVSKAAQKIIDEYRQKRQIDKELDQSLKN